MDPATQVPNALSCSQIKKFTNANDTTELVLCQGFGTLESSSTGPAVMMPDGLESLFYLA